MDNIKVDFFYLIISIFAVYLIIKWYIESKDEKLLYILAFFSLLIPIVDDHHIIPIICLILYYILLEKESILLAKFSFISKVLIIISLVFYLIGIIISIKDIIVVLEKNVYRFQLIEKKKYEYIKSIASYTDEINNYKVFYFLDYPFEIKLYENKKTNIFDLLIKGNLGKDEEKYVTLLEKECKTMKCAFIVSQNFFNTDSFLVRLEIKKYIENNTEYYKAISSKDWVYINGIY